MTSPLERQRAATVAVWRADVGVRPAGAWTDLGGLACHTTGLPVPYWNGAHLTSPDGLRRLPEARAWFAERAMPFGVLIPSEWQLDPALAHVTDQRVMLRDLAGLPDVPDVLMRWDDGAGAVAVQAETFGGDLLGEFVLPKLMSAACGVVVAYDGPTAVATATVVCVEGVAGVYGVGTLISHRRRGLGSAVTLAALHEAARRGCDLAFLNPSDLGYGVYASLGFTDAPPWRVYRPD